MVVGVGEDGTGRIQHKIAIDLVDRFRSNLLVMF